MKEETKKRKEEEAQKALLSPEEIEALAAKAEAGLKQKQEELLKRDAESFSAQRAQEELDPARQLHALTKKKRAEIIASGTPREVAYFLAIASVTAIDQGGRAALLKTEIDTIRARFNDKEKEEAMQICVDILALRNREESFRYDTITYLKNAAFLARYIAQWQEWQKWASKYTPGEEYSPYKFEHLEKMYLRRAKLEASLQVMKNRGAAIERYLKVHKLPRIVCPVFTRVTLADLEQECSLHDFELEEIYYRSYLNAQLDKGAELFSWAIEAAIIPSYKEIAPQEEEVKGYIVDLEAEAAALYNIDKDFLK